MIIPNLDLTIFLIWANNAPDWVKIIAPLVSFIYAAFSIRELFKELQKKRKG